MEEGDHHIPKAAITTRTTNNINLSSSNIGILCRLIFIILIGVVSIWADHEASKGFNITIVNEDGDSSPGKRFSLLYVSNDKATRIVLNATQFVQNLLDPHHNYPKNKVKVSHVVLRLSSRNLTQPVMVDSGDNREFVLSLSPSIMGETNSNDAVLSAVQRGMARVWLWDAPPLLVDAMVHCITILAGFHSELPESAVAQVFNYCERRRVGFVGRLNHRGTVEDVLDQHLCGSYASSMYTFLSTS